jgi:protein-S-isoprenylcysteine O-methyltransferase Ste14
MTMIPIFTYGLLWLSFAFVHSLLTLPSVKHCMAPPLGAAYRLVYNLLALLHIGIVFLIGRLLLDSDRYSLLSEGFIPLLLNILTGCGVLVLLLSLQQYDLGRFSGLSQLRGGRLTHDQALLEPLNTQGLNRFVRHPLYSGAFLYFWSNADSPFGLWTALFASVYLILGAQHEENNLVSTYGAAYQHYQAKVPAFVPWKTGK